VNWGLTAVFKKHLRIEFNVDPPITLVEESVAHRKKIMKIVERLSIFPTEEIPPPIVVSNSL
jgi:hypothetical protein